jgi:cytosine/uracil/thiamine/allantoin permease
MADNRDFQLLVAVLSIAGGLAFVVGVFLGMNWLIKKRQADLKRCYEHPHEPTA